ncbi:penicillin-binding transpeptidase domain-containing protein [Bacteroidota bacterium]
MSEEFHEMEESTESPERNLVKFWIVLTLTSLALLIIIIRLFVIQVYDSDRFQTRAKHQHQSKITLRAERGNIYDRNGKLIASTIHSISIAVDPKVLKEKYQVCKALEKATGKSFRLFLKKINSSKGTFVWLARGLMPDKSRFVDTLDFKGLLKFREPKRNFLYGNVGSQVVGAANIDNSGISGIEKAYDSLLTGTSGYMIMQRDARGRLHATADLPIIPAINGKSILLTLDIELQRIVEFELKRGVEKTQAASGTIIAIQPATGEILAMAAYPSYDPNKLSKRLPGAMKNKAITDIYEPGSTFKLITAAAAIEEGIMSPETMVNGYGGLLDFINYAIRDDHPVGKVTFSEAFEQSSNVVFAQVGDSIPKNKFYKYIRDFGFGNTLGIDIIGEVKGNIPRPKKIYPSTRRYLSHGYGLSVTGLQMANSYSTIANKGIMMKPYLVKTVLNSEGEIQEETEPQMIRRVISEKTCETLNEMLCGVVENGTGKRARIKGMKIAGKTGTSQQLENGVYSKQHYTGSFVGFYPADNPEIAMIVIIDKPKGVYYGGSTAAPIFQNIALRWLSVKNEFGFNEEVYDIDTVAVPSVKGFFSVEAMKILRDFGLNPILDNLNDGVVISQVPVEGSMMSKGSDVLLKAEKFNAIISDTLDKRTDEQEYKPDVRGFTLKKAVAILHKAGIHVRIIGKGTVRHQTWESYKNKQLQCTLNCR